MRRARALRAAVAAVVWAACRTTPNPDFCDEAGDCASGRCNPYLNRCERSDGGAPECAAAGAPCGDCMRCDEIGACAVAGCGDYACRAGTCQTGCDTGADCAGGATCDAEGRCGR